MVTKKTASGLARRPAPTQRTTMAPAAAPTLPPVPTTEVRLVYRGAADLMFRDGTQAKRKVRRDEPFTVDATTAKILLATDPCVEAAGRLSSPPVVLEAPVPTPEPTPPPDEDEVTDEVEPVTEGADDADEVEPVTEGADDAGETPTAEPAAPDAAGVITLGGLPPSALVDHQP